MSRGKRIAPFFLVALVASTAVLFAQQSKWWEKVFPKRSPQVLSSDRRTPLVQPPQEVLTLQDSFAKVAEAVKPAVVNIAAVHIEKAQQQNDPHEFFFGDPNEFFYRFFGEPPPGGGPPQRRRRPPQQQEFRMEGTGSGIIIDPEGYILTNNHVVQGADQLTVTLADGKPYKGKVVGTDSRTDLAVIRIRGSNPFAYIPLGDSSSLRIGDWVLAVGSPFGLEQTVTAGIISAIRQSLMIEGRSFRNLIQTDAAINRGNSGGPLVNLRGELVGVNTAIYAPTGVFSGIGFAIPVNDAKNILRDLIEKGFVERSWLGVEITEVDEVIARQFGLAKPEGALINPVLPESPAQKAGLRRGDIIVEFDGKKIPTVQSLQDFVSSAPPGKVVPLKYIREGVLKSATVKTAVMPKETTVAPGETEGETEPEPSAAVKWLGAGFVDNTEAARRRYGIEETGNAGGGIIVAEVPPDSAAAEAGLAEGDILRAVNRMPIKKTADVKKIMAGVDLKKGVVLDVVRRGRSFYLSYKTLQ